MADYINIKYDKGTKDDMLHERKIIPTHIPNEFISAIEVTELSNDQITEINKARNEYIDYTTLFKQNMFSFDDWLEHTNRKDIKDIIKYKRFTIDKTIFT